MEQERGSLEEEESEAGSPYDEEDEEDHGESITQMAVRLVRTLDYQYHERGLKRRYVRESWPETPDKHKKLGFLTEKWIPEVELREEKEISDLKALLRRSIKGLTSQSEKKGVQKMPAVFPPLLELSMGKLQELSDLELVKQAPSLLCNLNKKALKSMLHALSGRLPTSNHRYICEREIMARFAELSMPGDGEKLPDSLAEMVSILRSTGSYRHSLGSRNPHVGIFSAMPSSALAAAHEAFTRLGFLPTHIVLEVWKMLSMEDNTTAHSSNAPLLSGHRTHVQRVKAVKKKAERLLGYLDEGDPLPGSMDAALHIISLSARILFGDDGGLTRFLTPLSPEQVSLEELFHAAYRRLETMKMSDLVRICNGAGKALEGPLKSKHYYLNELQRLLTTSMHSVYTGTGIPEHVTLSMSMIIEIPHTGTKEVKSECSSIERGGFQKGVPTHNLCKKSKEKRRLRAELEAVLDVSAQLRRIVWECYEGINAQEIPKELQVNSMALDDSGAPMLLDTKQSRPKPNPVSFNQDAGMTVVGKSQSNVKVEIDDMEFSVDRCVEDVGACGVYSPHRGHHQDSDTFNQDVESFCDAAAATVYVLVGSLMKEFSAGRSLLLDPITTDYLNAGLEKPEELPCNSRQAYKLPLLSEDPEVTKVVLGMSRKLVAIPQRVIDVAELRLKDKLHSRWG